MEEKNNMEIGGGEGSPKTRPMVDIYILVGGEKGSVGTKWLKLTKSSSWGKYIEREYSPIPDQDIESPQYASIGSIIYATGGFTRSADTISIGGRMIFPISLPSDKVFYIDTCGPSDKGWEPAPPMKKKRMLHYVLVDDGKIYALGGHDPYHLIESIENKNLFAEVYDPKVGSWKPLACVEKDSWPGNICGHAVVDDGMSGRKILFHEYYSQSMHYLNTTHPDDVGVYDPKFGGRHPASAFLDGVLYHLEYKFIYAYEVSSSGLKKKHVVLRDIRRNTLPRREFRDDSWPVSAFLSLGNGHLALIWARKGNFALHLHCSIIEMEKKGDSIVGTVLNCSSHAVEDGGKIGALLAVSAPVTDVDEDAELGHKTESSNIHHKIRFYSSQHIPLYPFFE